MWWFTTEKVSVTKTFQCILEDSKLCTYVYTVPHQGLTVPHQGVTVPHQGGTIPPPRCYSTSTKVLQYLTKVVQYLTKVLQYLTKVVQYLHQGVTVPHQGVTVPPPPCYRTPRCYCFVWSEFTWIHTVIPNCTVLVLVFLLGVCIWAVSRMLLVCT